MRKQHVILFLLIAAVIAAAVISSRQLLPGTIVHEPGEIESRSVIFLLNPDCGETGTGSSVAIWSHCS